jgi:hypothetical protein
MRSYEMHRDRCTIRIRVPGASGFFGHISSRSPVDLDLLSVIKFEGF